MEMNFNGAKTYILQKLKDELSNNLYYHGLHHTLDVYNAAIIISEEEEISEPDRIILFTAALFHDSGFIKQYTNNETIAVALVEEVLPTFEYSDNQIAAISRIILSTGISVPPINTLECIMCDADHDYFGRSDYHVIANSLFRELAEYGRSMNEVEWTEQQIEFLDTRHEFYTKTSISTRVPRKKQNIEELKTRLLRLKSQ
ncbi:MAG: adenylate cyclase [Parvicellaceae bacterium]